MLLMLVRDVGQNAKCFQTLYGTLYMNPCTGNESVVVYFLHCELSIDKERWDVQ